MNDFNSFRSEWLTNPPRRVADASLVTSGEETAETMYQCVSLIKQYLRQCFNINPGAWGYAIQYWTSTHSTLLSRFNRIGSSDAQQGDVVILWGLPGNKYGHIGIATGTQTGSQIEIIEQNGQTGNGRGENGDAIRTRLVDKSRIAGLLRPIPVPQPTYESTTPRTLVTTKNPTTWLDLNTNQPATTLPVNTPFPVGGIARLADGRAYFMKADDWAKARAGDYSSNNGIASDDLTELPSPPPYVPPAPPKVATPPETYEVITPINYYEDSEYSIGYLDALHKQNPIGKKQPGTYIVYGEKTNGMINITEENHKPGVWINPRENVLAPVPVADVIVPTLPVDPPPVPVSEPVDVSDNSQPVTTPAPKTLYYEWLRGDRKPVWYHTKNVQEQRFKDLEDPDAPQVVLPPNKDIRFSMVTIKGGGDWLIPTKSLESGHRHGVPSSLLDEVTGHTALDYNNDGKVNTADFIDGIQGFVDYGSKLFGVTKNTLYKVAANPKISQAKVKLIDGFTAGKRKAK